MHVIVVGCGRVGSGLALQLQQAGHSVAIVDRNAKAFRRLSSEYTGERLVGLGFDRDTLVAAGAERAGAFAAVTSGDNSNILAARIAKETFQIGSVVARIYDPRRAEIYQRLGIATVATVAWTTDQVQRRLLADHSSNWTDASGSLGLVEVALPGAWAGRPLERLDDTDRIRVVAVSRGGRSQLAMPGLVGQEGDVLHVMVHSDATADLTARLAAGPAAH